MSDPIIGIFKVSYGPSGRYEEAVGYVHYAFDAQTAITRLHAENPSEYITKALPCLTPK